MKGRLPETPLRCFAPSTTTGVPRLRVVAPEDNPETPEVRVFDPSARMPRRPTCSPAAHPKPTGPRLFLPQGYEPGYRYPLLIWLPEAGRLFDLGRSMSRLSLRNYVAIEAAGSLADPDQAIWHACDTAMQSATIHPQRIFLIGVGTGGTTALRLACRHAGEFAGVVSLGGPFPLDEGCLARLTEIRRLPMLMCTDRTESAGQGASIDRTLRVFHAAGTTLALRVYPAACRLTRGVLADVNRWVMETAIGPSTLTPTLAR